jgi:fibronectin-binding autotransporter adhesin
MKVAHLPLAWAAALAVGGFFAPIASANFLDWNVGNGLFNAASSWTRDSFDTNPPDADGVPDSDDRTVFGRGGGITYTVTFPSHSLVQPPADYFSATTAIGSNNVSFVGSTGLQFGPSTLSTSAITISGSPINPAVLSTSLGQLSTETADIGFVSGTAATLNVNAGTFAVTGSSGEDLLIGGEGTGTLNVNAGAQATLTSVNGHAVLGDAAGVSGTANVSGAGATWMNTNNNVNAGISVGGLGIGMFNITAGGQVNFYRSYIADGAGSTGIATVSGAGSVWTNREELIVGTLGSGSLTISGGGQVFDGSSIICANPSADGTANITGAGSKWTQTGDLRLGSNSSFNGDTGPGVMLILAGGQVATGGDGNVGSVGSGTVTVDGNGSKWSIAGQMIVRLDSVVGVTNGGQVTSDSATVSGSVNVTGGGSILNTADFLTVGNSSSLNMADPGGTLNTFGGGQVHNRVAIVGDSRGYGQVVIGDAGSTWNTDEQLYVGLEGKGEFFVSSGAQVTSASTQVGVAPNSLGSVGVGGAGSKWTDTSNMVVGVAGSGTLTVSNNAVAQVDGVLSVGPHGTVEGNSQVIANLRNGGTVAPGLATSLIPTDALGTLHLGGDFTQTSAGTLQIQLASISSFDALAIDGHATLGGTLKGSLFGGFAPAVGSAFQILTATDGITGTFTLDFSTFGTLHGPSWILVYSNSDVVLKFVNLPAGDYNRNGVVDAADYTVWRDTFGQSGSLLRADGDGDHDVDADDYAIWKTNFGLAAGSGALSNTAVPEPSTLMLLFLTAACWCLRKCRAALRVPKLINM